MRAAFCLDDAAPCPKTISIGFRDPLVEVSIWVVAPADPNEPVVVEAFNGQGQVVDRASASLVDLEFQFVSLAGSDIRSIVAEVPTNVERNFYIDDLHIGAASGRARCRPIFR